MCEVGTLEIEYLKIRIIDQKIKNSSSQEINIK